MPERLQAEGLRWAAAHRPPQPTLYGSTPLSHRAARAAHPRRVRAPLHAIFLALAVALVALAAPRVAVAAPPSALFVYGRSESRLQIIVQEVVDRILRDAGWPLVPPFNDNESSIVRGCLGKASPWNCLESMATKKGIQRIVTVRVDFESSADGTSQIIVTGRLVYSGSETYLEQQRFCGACSDDDLKSYSEEVAKLLLDERAIAAGNTKVGVSSIPMGAEVRIDGKVVGITNSVFATSPGKHTVEIRARGHRPEKRDVTSIEGKTVSTTVTLQKGDENAPPGTGEVSPGPGPDVSIGGGGGDVDEGSGGAFRKWGPKAMVGGGGVLVVTGIILLVIDEPEVTKKGPDVPQYHRESTLGGAIALVGGAALAGAGGYLWWKFSRTETTPIVSTSSNGVVVGFAGAF